MLRRLLLLFVGVKVGPSFVITSERCTESLPTSRSTSSHFNPRSSPPRIPVLTANTSKNLHSRSWEIGCFFC